MQKKITTFLKPSSGPNPADGTSISNDSIDESWLSKQSETHIKYTRRKTTVQCQLNSGVESSSGRDDVFKREEESWKTCLEGDELKPAQRSRKVLNKKRSYAQFYLDLGQSNFLFHTCSVCRMKYAKGDLVDEKLHNDFHKNCTHGIQFKGWRHERVIHGPSVEGGRILLVLKSDPPAQWNKVQEVIKMMETELGDGWILHDQCQVYLFISAQRIAGCVVVEHIENAYKILTDSAKKATDTITTAKATSKSTKLQFGGACFRRETVRRFSPQSVSEASQKDPGRAIFCGEEAIPAVCGIRAIWVSPSNRRKGIATFLLDAVRRSFCGGSFLECSKMAFSQPSIAGRSLASRFTGTESFLVYKTC